MGIIVFAVILTLVAAGAVQCASLTRRNRDYWPMLRVLWAAIAFQFGGGAFGVVVSRGAPTARDFLFAGVALAAVGYSVWFMRKRNRLPRFLQLTVGGDVLLRTTDELRQATMLAESWAAHGAMPDEQVAALRAALAEWEAKRAWAAGLARQARERREGGIPGDDD